MSYNPPFSGCPRILNDRGVLILVTLKLRISSEVNIENVSVSGSRCLTEDRTVNLDDVYILRYVRYRMSRKTGLYSVLKLVQFNNNLK